MFEVLHPFRVEFWAGWEIEIWSHSSSSWISFSPAPFAKDAAFSPLFIFSIFAKKTKWLKNYMDLGLRPQFYSRHFCSSAMLFLWLWLSGIIWNEVRCYLLWYSFCSEFFWVFLVFRSSKYTLISFLCEELIVGVVCLLAFMRQGFSV